MVCKCGHRNTPGSLCCSHCGTCLAEQKKPRIGRRWLAAMLALVLVLGCFLTGCSKDEEGNGLKDNLGQRGETEAAGEETGASETEESPAQEDPIPEPETDGWYISDSGDVYLYADGAVCTGFYYNAETAVCGEVEFESGWYYFDESGVMQKNRWIEDGENVHCILESGVAAAPGWYSDETGWYYLEEKGLLCRGTDVQGDGVHFLIDEDGYLSELRYDKLTGISETGPVEGSRNRTYTVFETPIESCISFTFTALREDLFKADGSPSWNLWLRMDGQWVNMEGQYNCFSHDGEVTVTFQAPVSFDAFYKATLLGFGDQEPELLDVIIVY